MIAFVIVAHQSFENVATLLKGIYDQRNTYCICVNRFAIGEALKVLHRFSALGNVYFVSADPTSWGDALEAYMKGIDFCLRVNGQWKSLIALSGADLPLVAPSNLIDLVSTEYDGKVVLQSRPQSVNFDAESDAVQRMLDDPFKKGMSINDLVFYNPFSYPISNYTREGVQYLIGPGSNRSAWSDSSTFITLLTRQINSYADRKVYTERQSQFSIRLLETVLRDKPVAMSSFWGIFPRDFCAFATSDQWALTLYNVISRSFSIEEAYFATLSANEPFVSRNVSKQIMYKLGKVDARLSSDDLDPQKTAGFLLARKIPDGPAGVAMMEEAYLRYGIEADEAFTTAERVGWSPSIEGLLEKFRCIIDITKCRFEFGALAQLYANSITMEADGLISYHHELTHHTAGIYWEWRGAAIETRNELGGDLYALFDAFRCHGTQMHLIGNWMHHHGVPIVLVAPVEPAISSEIGGRYVGVSASEATDITSSTWEAWLSDRAISRVEFDEGGVIYQIDASAGQVHKGYWRIRNGSLLTIGLFDMLIAAFDLPSTARGQRQIAGVSLGCVAAIEPCFLRRVDGLSSPDQ